MQALFASFRAILITADQRVETADVSYLSRGVILSFAPTPAQRAFIETVIRDSNIKTLFSREEARDSSLHDKLLKQIAH